MKVTNRMLSQDWRDIGFTALPLGWINVWHSDDNDTYFTEPCPGVLIQECTSGTRTWDEEYEDGRVEHRYKDIEIERETRTVFAHYEDGSPSLDPVEFDNDDYVVTTTIERLEQIDSRLRGERRRREEAAISRAEAEAAAALS